MKNRNSTRLQFFACSFFALFFLNQPNRLLAQCTPLASITLNIVATPTPTISGDLEICAGQTTILTASNGGASNPTYLWSTGASTPTINVSTSGTFTVTVTKNGCSGTASATVDVAQAVDIDIIGPNTICGTQAIILNATGNNSNIVWSTGATTTNISVSTIGTYSVTATDANGCTGVDSQTITVAPGPVVSVSTPIPTVCQGETAQLVLNFSTPTPPGVDYNLLISLSDGTWTNLNDVVPSGLTYTINYMPTATLTYTLVLIGSLGNCPMIGSPNSAVIEVNPTPSPVISGNLNPCAGQSTTLTSTDGGTANPTYSWSTGAATPSITVSASGTYTVTVTKNGCPGTASATVDVIPPTPISVNGGGLFCGISSTPLSAIGNFTSYLWSTGETAPTINVTTSGTFTVTATDAAGCTATSQATVTFSPNPTANAGPNSTICDGQTATLTATGGGTYAWSTGQSGPTISVNPNSMEDFTVTVTNAAGCTATDVATVFVDPPPPLSTSVNGPICPGNQATLTASGTGSFSWNTGQNTAIITVSPPVSTLFSVTLTDANGCTSTDEIQVIVNPMPIADAGPDVNLCIGQTAVLTASGGSDFVWSTGDNGSVIDVTPATTTTFSVTVSENGCDDVDAVQVVVLPLPMANAGPNQSINSGQSATLSATGGSNYAWSNGQSGASISVSPTVTTTFSVTVTDAAGCTAVDEITVFVDELFTPDLGPDQSICLGQTATLTAALTQPPNTTILWSTGQTTPQITVSPANTANFSVTLTNSSGQTTTDELTVFVNELPLGPASIAGQTSICVGLDGTFSIQPVSGATSYFWQIGPPATLVSGQGTTYVQVNFPTGATSIPVSVLAENGCGQSPATAISVQVNELPGTPSLISGDLAPCASTVVDYQILPVIGATNYNWQILGGGILTAGQGTTKISINWNNSTGGTVCVVAENACGPGQPICIAVQTSAQASANAGPDTVTCLSTTSLAASGNGSWSQTSGSASLNLSSQTDPTAGVTSTQSGSYSLVWTVGTGVCQAKDTVKLTFHAAPTVAALTENCNPINTAFTVNLTLAGGTAPYFIDGISVGNGPFSSLEIPNGSSYSFLLTDSNGCLAPQIVGQHTCNCTTQPGQMQLSAQNICIGDSLHATFLGGGNFDGDDVLGFALHSGSAPAGILAVSSSPDFGWLSGLAAGQTVFISAIIGSNNGAGLPDLTDPCLAISAGVPMTIRALPTATLSASAPSVCEGDCLDLQFNFGGDGPFSITFNENGQQKSLAILLQNSTQNICPTTATTIELLSVNGQFCENTASDVVQIPVGQSANATVAPADEVCNTTTSGFPTTLNFNSYLLGGDATGTWADLSASGAAGVFPNLDFNGVTPGFYTFEYTTAAATAPCLNQKYQLEIEVTATCTCPPVAILPPPTICNLPASGFNLSDLVVPGSAPGSWSISNSQTGSTGQIQGNYFNPYFTTGGQYELTYTLLSPPPGNCAATASVVFAIEEAPSSGQSTSPLTLCEKEDPGQPVDLFLLLENEDVGGSWKETSAVLSQNGAFLATSGQFSPETQFPAAYFFEYAVPATAICPAAATTVEVLILPGPGANAGPDQTLTCDQPTVVLGAAQPGVTFKWTNPNGSAGPTTATYSVSQTGLFVVETRNFFGCKTLDSVLVSEDKNLPMAIISGAAAALTCSNPTTVLDGNGSSPAGLNFEWILNGATVGSQTNLTVSTGGCFVLRVKNPANGCIDTASVCIGLDQTLPNIQLSPAPMLTCKLDSAALWAIISQAGQPQILWTTTDGNIISPPNSAQIVVDAPGFYTISVENMLNGCIFSAGLVVDENVVSPVATASALNDLTCKQPTTDLSSAGSTGGPNLLFEWSGGVILSGANSPTATVGAPGNYVLTVENPQNGCTATDETTVISIGQSAFPVSISSRPPTCPGDCDGTLTVENQQINGLKFSFSGNDFSTDTTWANLCAGNYSLKIKDVNGCEWDSTRTLLDPPQIFVELGPDATVRLGDSLLMEAFFSQSAVDLNWSPAPPDCGGLCQKFWFSPIEPTIFNIIATDANGCTASDSQKISIENADDVYVPNAFRPQASTGSSQFFTVFAGTSVRKVQLLQVYSRWGELVFQQLDFQPNVPESGWNGRLRGDWMNPGVFVWRAKIEYVDGRTRELSGDLTVF